MHNLQFLLFLCSSAFALASFFYGSGEEEGTEVWQITRDIKIRKLSSENTEFTSSSSYIVLRTEVDETERTTVSGESSEKVKRKGILTRCFSGSLPKKEFKHVHYIHYLILKETGTFDEIQDYEKKVVDYMIELFLYLKKKNGKEATIFKETSGKETSEFIMLFPFVLQQEAEYAEEISELGINARLQNLYKIDRITEYIKTVPLEIDQLNTKDAFVVDAGTDLIVILNKSENSELLKKMRINFTNFLKRQKRRVIEKIHHVKNFSSLKSRLDFRKLFPIFNENKFVTNTSKTLKNNLENEERYELIEYSGNKKGSTFDTSELGHITSDMIEANKWYILKNHLTKEIFLYITPNLETKVMIFILYQGQDFVWLHKEYKVSIVQHHALTVPFIVSFRNLMNCFKKHEDEESVDSCIKRNF